MEDRINPVALGVCDAARYLGVSRANLYRLFRSGKLKPIKLGGRTLVRRVDVDALLERAANNPSSPQRAA